MYSDFRYKLGDKIGGRYQVHRSLVGGMGEVYLCLDLKENLPYALKTFQRRFANNPNMIASFEREVATWVSLEKHPNIVRCFNMEIHGEVPFMVLEWVASEYAHGSDLRNYLRHSSLDLVLTLNIAIDICRGLVYANRMQPGIVHRDLKPENILIGQERLAKITDFGLAKIVADGKIDLGGALNQTGFAGTPLYMAPEQWQGKELDVRTDLYAVGLILFEMLAGKHPFFQASKESSSEALREWHSDGRIEESVFEIPSEFHELVSRCISVKRENRYSTASELLDELIRVHRHFDGEQPRTVEAGVFYSSDYNNRATTYADLKLYEKALEDFGNAIRLNPNNAGAFHNRGKTHDRLKLYEEALSDYRQAIQIDPNSSQNYFSRAMT